MQGTAQNATGRDVFAPRASREPRLGPEDMRDLIRAVRALSIYAEHHGLVEAELLVHDLLDDLTAAHPPRR